MVIVVDIRTNSCVIVSPLLSSDDSVAVLVSKAGEEFDEDLFWCHFTASYFRMHRAVVDNTKVGSIDLTVAVLIKLAVCLPDDVHSLLVGSAADANKELVVADDAILVCVKVLEEECGLIF